MLPSGGPEMLSQRLASSVALLSLRPPGLGPACAEAASGGSADEQQRAAAVRLLIRWGGGCVTGAAQRSAAQHRAARGRCGLAVTPCAHFHAPPAPLPLPARLPAPAAAPLAASWGLPRASSTRRGTLCSRPSSATGGSGEAGLLGRPPPTVRLARSSGQAAQAVCAPPGAVQQRLERGRRVQPPPRRGVCPGKGSTAAALAMGSKQRIVGKFSRMAFRLWMFSCCRSQPEARLRMRPLPSVPVPAAERRHGAAGGSAAGHPQPHRRRLCALPVHRVHDPGAAWGDLPG